MDKWLLHQNRLSLIEVNLLSLHGIWYISDRLVGYLNRLLRWIKVSVLLLTLDLDRHWLVADLRWIVELGDHLHELSTLR